jgi:hypothetical protein
MYDSQIAYKFANPGPTTSIRRLAKSRRCNPCGTGIRPSSGSQEFPARGLLVWVTEVREEFQPSGAKPHLNILLAWQSGNAMLLARALQRQVNRFGFGFRRQTEHDGEYLSAATIHGHTL